MSTLKNTYNNVEDIPEGMESIYSKQEDGSYTVSVEGQVDKGRVDEFRENNINLRKQIEGFESTQMDYEKKITDMQVSMKSVEDKFANINLDEWNDLQAERKANAEKELIEKRRR